MSNGIFRAAAFKPILVLIALCLLLFFFRLGRRDLHSSHEARAAQNAQYMLSRGDWAIPKLFNDRLDLQKPPLFYWIVASLGWLHDGIVNPWIVRLPSAVSALGCVLVVFFVGLRLGNLRTGFLAGLLLATSLHFTWLARVGRIDMPFTFALTLAIAGMLLARQRSAESRTGLGWSALSYVALACAMLLKGPLALVLFVLWQATHWFLTRGSRDSASQPARSTWWWGYPLVFLLVSPWFVWANWKTDNRLFEVFFWYHNVQRGLGGSENLASHPFWYYIPRLAVDLLPWSLILPWALWRYRRTDKSERGEIARLGLAWFSVFFAFFSLMSFKRADYLLPLFPGIALFLGAMVDANMPRNALRLPSARTEAQGFLTATLSARRLARSIPLLALLTCVAWVGYLQFLDAEAREGWVWQNQARAIRAHTDRPVIFFRTEAHALAFYVGRPLDTILEWENLDIWASERGLIYFVMPADCADHWRDHLTKGRLVEYARIHDSERPLVILHSESP